MTCPYLEYRDEAGDLSFDAARAYCTAAERFVQPMRADICNDRYELDHAAHCEIYLEHAPADDDVPDPGSPPDGRTDTSDEGDAVSNPAAANEAVPGDGEEADDEDEEVPDS